MPSLTHFQLAQPMCFPLVTTFFTSPPIKPIHQPRSEPSTVRADATGLAAFELPSACATPRAAAACGDELLQRETQMLSRDVLLREAREACRVMLARGPPTM